MLAGFCHTYTLIFMKRIGCNNINGVNVFIFLYAVKILVVVTILLRNIIFSLPVRDLRRSTTNYPNKFSSFAGLHGFSHTGAVAAKTHNSDSQYWCLL